MPVRPQPFNVRGKRLVLSFVIIEQPYLGPDELNYPDRRRVADANIPICLFRHERIVGDLPNPAFLASLRQSAGIISAFDNSDKITFPDVSVLLWPAVKVVGSLLLEDGREPRIVCVINLYDLAPMRRVLAEPLVRGTVLSLRFHVTQISESSSRIVGVIFCQAVSDTGSASSTQIR